MAELRQLLAGFDPDAGLSLPDDWCQGRTAYGGLTAANGQEFRDKILSRGNSVELSTLYRDFRGKDPSVEPLLKFRGLK